MARVPKHVGGVLEYLLVVDFDSASTSAAAADVAAAVDAASVTVSCIVILLKEKGYHLVSLCNLRTILRINFLNSSFPRTLGHSATSIQQ